MYENKAEAESNKDKTRKKKGQTWTS
jgi:hypothetical protein